MKENKKKIDNFKIIVAPFVTEKSTSLLNKNNKNVFIVDGKANKNQIKNAFQDIFGVEVISVNTEIIKKIKKKGKRISNKAKLSKFKKAIITLKKDQKINLFDE